MKRSKQQTGSPTEIDKAFFNPAAVFATPEEVLGRDDLSPEQKVEILRRWQYDASEEAVALEEGMPGGEPALLRRIMLALVELTGGEGMADAGEGKQRGLPRSRHSGKPERSRR